MSAETLAEDLASNRIISGILAFKESLPIAGGSHGSLLVWFLKEAFLSVATSIDLRSLRTFSLSSADSRFASVANLRF